jgi:long-chain acyl-CoA synthetase
MRAMNLAAVIDAHPDDDVALVSGDEAITYGGLRQRVAAARGALAARGVQPGDRVALIAENEPTFAVAYLAILGLGAVAVPLNPTSPEPELTRELQVVGARVAVVGDNRNLPDDVTVLRPDQLTGDPGAAPAVDRADTDLAVLVFTAGTAGSPKAAKLTHGNLLANLTQVRAHPGRDVYAHDVGLGVLPLFHIFGLNVVLGLLLQAGGRVVLERRFDPAESLDLIARHGVTLVAGAPPMYRAWAELPADAAAADAFAGVRLATSGAAPLGEDVAAAFTGRYGLFIHQGYGLTEAAPVVTSSLLDRPPRPGSIGVPLPGIDIRLVDDEDEDALVGDPGEIRVHGPNVFGGYWEDAAATAAALTPDGWLRTGDIAVADESGHLYLVDRAKDLIIVSGFNVYPAEVEEVLLEHPGIAEAAVVGVPAAATGEAVAAFVVKAAGASVTERDVTEFAAARLARYKAPTEVSFVDELPRAVAGKVLRRQLRPA